MNPPNRRARRAAASRARRAQKRSRNVAGQDSFYESFIRHLPETPADAPLVPGTVNFLVFHHDEDCAFHSTNNPSDCTCSPTVARHYDPGVRQ